METFIINVPDQKTSLVKELLKELGVEVKSQYSEKTLIDKINKSIKPGKKPTMEEIVEEVNAVRRERNR